MIECDISYDNDHQGIYFSGETLSGTIEIKNEKIRSIKGIILKIEGFAKCNWTETISTGQGSSVIFYSGREDYIKTNDYLLKSSNDDRIDLDEGIHKFNFVHELSPELPTSLESKYGSIRYQIKVIIERPWKTDFKFCYAFTILKPLDLNHEDQSLKLPLKMEASKGFFLGFSSKNLSLSAEIPFCGYVSGQSVSVNASISNESKIEVSEVTIELMKKICYKADSFFKKSRLREERLAISKHQSVPSNHKSQISSILLIPSVPPTNTGTCRPVHVYYEIIVTAKTLGMHRNLKAVLPITIGTVPLVSTYQQSSLNIQPSTSQASRIAHDLPPPSYQEAMMTTTQEEDINEKVLDEDEPFNPKYPFFDFTRQVPTPPSDPKNEKKPF